MIRDLARTIWHLPTTIRRMADRKRPTQEVFSQIYGQKAWGEKEESVSGPGSNMAQTGPIRAALPGIFKSHNIRSMLDAPCGDFFWMKTVDLSGIHYIGGDIVPSLIETATRDHAAPGSAGGLGKREFRVLNIIDDQLPKVDVILCRDCLVHLSFEQIFKALANFKRSGSTFVLTTTFFEGVPKNKDIIQGDWRALDFQAAPFSFPKPIQLVDERGWYDKASKGMGLWRIADLPM